MMHISLIFFAATIGAVLLLEPFADSFMPSRTPVVIEANRTPFKAIHDTGADDGSMDVRNVIKAFQLDEPYDVSICFCGFYAEYVRAKLVKRISTGELTREQVDGFCPEIIKPIA
jgi:hypothetical protein